MMSRVGRSRLGFGIRCGAVAVVGCSRFQEAVIKRKVYQCDVRNFLGTKIIYFQPYWELVIVTTAKYFVINKGDYSLVTCKVLGHLRKILMIVFDNASL